jgi:hypothetical protein
MTEVITGAMWRCVGYHRRAVTLRRLRAWGLGWFRVADGAADEDGGYETLVPVRSDALETRFMAFAAQVHASWR